MENGIITGDAVLVLIVLYAFIMTARVTALDMGDTRSNRIMVFYMALGGFLALSLFMSYAWHIYCYETGQTHRAIYVSVDSMLSIFTLF